MSKMWTRTALAAALIGLSAGLAGCSKTEAEQLDAARASIGNRDNKAASIHLKNVLSQNPNSGQARALLGRALLDGGTPATAEIELRKAKELKVDAAEWAPALARAMLLQLKIKPLIEEFGAMSLPQAGAQADLHAFVATALSVDGQRDKAAAMIEATLATLPHHGQTLMLKARMMARPGSLDEAIALVDGVLAREPKNVEAWHLAADLQLFGKRDTAKARANYEKALTLQPDLIAAHTSLILIDLAANNLEAARKQLARMSQGLPRHPQTQMLDAQISFLAGDALRARDLTQQLLRTSSSNVPLMVLAAAVELKLDGLTQAEPLLRKILAERPDHQAARRMLADLLMRSNRADKALEVLAPSLEGPSADPTSLSQAAQVYMVLGELNKAETLFQRAAKLAPADPKFSTALALTHLAKGQPDAAYDELRQLSKSTDSALPDMALVSALMRRQQVDQALQAVDGLERKLPKQPVAANLRGRILMAKRDLPGARKSFDQALAIDPKFLPAIASLGAIDLAEGKATMAEARYEALLKAEPNNKHALLALAQLKARAGADKAVVGKYLEEAIQADPTDPAARLLLIHHWLGQRDMKAARVAAQAGLAAMPDNLSMLDALGSLQLVMGEANQAISTFSKVIAKQPESTRMLLRLAEAHLQNKDLASAEKAFKRALDLQPTLLDAQKGLIGVALASRQPERALTVARGIQRQLPKDALGFMIEGDIHAAFRNWDAAIKAYRAGLTTPQYGKAPERLYALLVSAKDKAEAQRFAAEWAAKQPTDTQLMMFIANNAVNSNELDDAERYYAAALKVDPKQVSAMNNLAWVLAKQGKPGAVAMAEKALAMSPESPTLLDTLGFALAADKQWDRAIEATQAALLKTPDEPIYRFNLAKIYASAGDAKRARNELDQLLLLGTKFARHAEVKDMLMSLKP